jgi:transaldolase|tara:strand:+ start:1771 stop:2466 length:696 start_codon:yes stop_codon:yes gene_type:complete
MTKIYCDTADVKTIKNQIKKYKIDGVTTNPSIMRANGVNDYKAHCLKILKLTKKKPLSVEVFADEPAQILNQANKISLWDKYLFVKIPIVNTKGKILSSVIQKLNSNKVRLNITAIFTLKQIKEIKKVIDNKTPIIISIFCGRIADNGIDPEIITSEAVSLFRNYKNVQILWASTREVFNYQQAKKCKCHIITMSPNLIEKLNSKKLPLNEYSIKTVNQFFLDGKKSKFNI